MFDLNINIEANKNGSSAHNDMEMEVKEELPEGSGTNTELSSTSSASSVVNAATTADDAAAEFNFFPSSEFVTRQFFPVSKAISDERETELELLRVGSSQHTNTTHHQWLNLAVSGSGSGSEQLLGNKQQQQVRKSRRGPRSRSSQYRGVTFYRRTGRWESHIWDCGKQVYLGGFDTALAAARAYDRAAIKFRGVEADINFNTADYDEEMKEMKNLNKEEFVHILRRHSTGFSRGSSRYRGVTLHKCGRWEARMGQLLGKKAYDLAAIRCNGREAITNFEPSSYEGQLPMLANNGVDGHNLDLNLGISVTIDGPKASDYVGAGESQTEHFPFRPANEKRPMNGSSTYSLQSAQTLYVQQLASRQPTITWPEAYQDKVGDQKVEAHFSAGSLSNWSWFMQSQGQKSGRGGGSGGTTTTQIQPLSGAASSGFSFSATPSSSSTFPSITNPRPNLL